jgi:hypothetical protein
MLYPTFYRFDDLIHITYHRLCQVLHVAYPMSSLPITSYISHFTCLISHITYIVRYSLHITPYVSHSTHYLSTYYRFQNGTYPIKNVTCRMLYLTFYRPDNLIHITYPDCVKILHVAYHISSLPITSYISHITCLGSHITYIVRYLLPITPYVSHGTYYLFTCYRFSITYC